MTSIGLGLGSPQHLNLFAVNNSLTNHCEKLLGWETAEKHVRTCNIIFLCKLLKCFTKNQCTPWFAIDHVPGCETV